MQQTHSVHPANCFSEGKRAQPPRSSVPWGVYSWAPKGPVTEGSGTRGEGRQEPTDSPSSPNRSRALLLLAASSQSPGSQEHASLSAFSHTRCSPGVLVQLPLAVQSISQFQAQPLPPCSCKCSCTWYALSSDCTPDRYSITMCEGKGGERRISPTEPPPLPATVLGAVTSSPPALQPSPSQQQKAAMPKSWMSNTRG